MSYHKHEYSYNTYAEILRLKEQGDRLARIACKAMTALEKDGHADFLLLKDDEVRDWWLKHKEADRKRQEEARKRTERAEQKAVGEW